ncbi:hypothetical protein E0L36_21995 [Streptomyces sp. AJS327]|uniref:hypothetical protein n=1 Tax=Streptomyces sp. AJS327 TaxID=2545265 RepID=UPI0015E04D78|nr:hypothetical protein [Streptomyces sp. AJS327]MBA0053449.1 hypothetical protein [Streptomyces sp. AJS327]
MGYAMPTVRFKPYGPDRFLRHLPFGATGYLFTVPGNHPADLPDFFRVTNWEMAVYRTRGSGAPMWEVRDVNGHRRVWGEDTTRRGAVGLAFAELARHRRKQADEVRDRRVNVLGLEPVPPYRVETSGGVCLILSLAGVGRLTRVEPADEGPATYRYTDLATGKERTVAADGPVELRDITAGLLHDRCTCSVPGLVGHHEHREDATAYLEENYDAWWPCTGRAA